MFSLVFTSYAVENDELNKEYDWYVDAIIQTAENEKFSKGPGAETTLNILNYMKENNFKASVTGIENVCSVGMYSEWCKDWVGTAVELHNSLVGGDDDCKNFDYSQCYKIKPQSNYTNPQTNSDKLRKCVFDKAVDWMLSGYEKGAQRSSGDAGNVYIDAQGNRMRGATNWGITTQSTNWHPCCVLRLSREDAKYYYWNAYFMGYGYHRLPLEVQAVVMQLSAGGTGYTYNEILRAADCSREQCGSGTVVGPKTATAVENHVRQYGAYGENGFNKRITEERKKDRANTSLSEHYSERAQEAYNKLNYAYEQCKKQFGISSPCDTGYSKIETFTHYTVIDKDTDGYQAYLAKINNHNYYVSESQRSAIAESQCNELKSKLKTNYDNIKKQDAEMKSFATNITNWTKKTSYKFKDTQTETESEAWTMAAKQLVQDLNGLAGERLVNYYINTTFKCTGKCNKIPGTDDTVTCKNTSGTIEKKYIFDDICD